jgi:hypothetical protein
MVRTRAQLGTRSRKGPLLMSNRRSSGDEYLNSQICPSC